MGTGIVRLEIAFLLAFCGLVFSQQQSVQGIPCSGQIEYHSNGNISSCTLAREDSIEGYLLPQGSILDFRDNGTLDQCVLVNSSSICGQLFPAHTVLFFNHWGEKLSFWLPSKTTIQGHMIAATDDGIGNSIYPNGSLKAVWLADDQDIDGIPCTSSGNIFRFGLVVMRLGTQRMAWFHDNGRLQQAMLSRDATIQSHRFLKGDIVNFDATGKLDLGAKRLK